MLYLSACSLAKAAAAARSAALGWARAASKLASIPSTFGSPGFSACICSYRRRTEGGIFPWQKKRPVRRQYSKKGQGRSAESHYPTMCIEDIKALPVGELAAKDCALFLWITFPCLCEALEVLTAWGFSYKTVAFVWVKQNRRNDDLFTGMGYWTRANAEICILATKGHPKRVDAGVRCV